MEQMTVIDYISTLTGFVLDNAVCKRIAMDRGVLGITDVSQLDDRTKDLLKADVLFYVYSSPNSTASISKKHGTYSQTVGSQTVTDKRGIYNLMCALYRKWNDDKLEAVEAMDGGLQWLSY